MSLRQLMVVGLCVFCSGVWAAETYQVRPLSEIAFYPMRSASATALSLNQSILSAQIQANVESIKVGVAQQVKQGDTLLNLDCTDYRLAMEQAAAGVKIAKARLQLAESQKSRNEQLLGKKLTSQESADTTIAESIARSGELEQSKIALRQATLNVERCTIQAPFDGIVQDRLINEGQFATVGTPLLTVVQTDQMELSAQVKPADVKPLEQAKELYFDDGKQYPVRLLRAGGLIDSTTRSQEIRLQFLAVTPPPGSAGKLVWRDAQAHINPQYIVQRQGVLGVFLAQEGRAEFVPIPEAIPGRPVPTNLAQDVLLIVDGLGQIKNGESL